MLRKRALVGAAVIGAGIVAVAGCGSSGPAASAANAASGLSAAQLQAQSARRAGALSSFTLDLNGSAAVTLPSSSSGSSPLGALFNGSTVPVTATGPVAGTSFSLAATLSFDQRPVPFTLTQTGGHLYVVAQGHPLVLTSTHAALDIASAIAGIIRAMTGTSVGPATTIGATRTVELSGHIDGAAAAASAVGPLVRQLPGLTNDATAAGRRALVAALDRGTIHDWVRTSDLLPARVQVQASLPGAASDGTGRPATFDLTLTLSGYDQLVHITAPAQATPITPGQLAQAA